MSKKFSKSRVIIFSIILLILIGFAFIQNKNLITDQTVNNPLFLQYKGDISIDKKAMKEIKKIEDLGMDKLPICIAKTQFSLSDDATKLGRPEGFTLNVKEIRLSAGAGFIVALTGNVMVMPGLPKVPAAENIDVDENGKITGLF